MALKKNGVFFLMGLCVYGYFSRKIYIQKDCTIERQKQNVNLFDRWMTLRDKEFNIGKYLENMGIKKVAIYGLGLVGNHLYEELYKSEIEIVGIDRADIYNNFRMSIFKPDEYYGDIDMIIVTPTEYNEVYQTLRKRYEGTIISFQELLNKCEEFLWPI